jgi:hypothetical protein
LRPVFVRVSHPGGRGQVAQPMRFDRASRMDSAAFAHSPAARFASGKAARATAADVARPQSFALWTSGISGEFLVSCEGIRPGELKHKQLSNPSSSAGSNPSLYFDSDHASFGFHAIIEDAHRTRQIPNPSFTENHPRTRHDQLRIHRTDASMRTRSVISVDGDRPDRGNVHTSSASSASDEH